MVVWITVGVNKPSLIYFGLRHQLNDGSTGEECDEEASFEPGSIPKHSIYIQEAFLRHSRRVPEVFQRRRGSNPTPG